MPKLGRPLAGHREFELAELDLGRPQARADLGSRHICMPKLDVSWPYGTPMTDTPVMLSPIGDGQVDQVAEFLHRELNPKVAVKVWAQGMRAEWMADAHNHGFMLTEGNEVVGANIAFYSEREVNGRPERFCNLGALCVVESRRAHAVRLIRAALRQPGYHFTDLSPSGNVIELNQRLGFHSLDTATVLQINWPVPPTPSLRITADLAEIEATLSGRDLRIFRDHRDSPAARHLLVASGPDRCYVIGRRDRRKKVPVFVSILYVSNERLFRRSARHIARHFLLRAGALATLLETRVTGQPPAGSIALRHPRPKMFKSSQLSPCDIDYLYSELTQIEW
jgi:hypothetical protein